MAGTFDTIITQGVRAGQIPARTQAAREWYRNTAKSYNVDDRKIMREDKARLTNTIMPGSMYMYHYDPKYKETLPFYDRFPLVFPFKVQADRFWGINFHYLPLNHRAILMDGLYELANNQRYDESTRLRMSYEILNHAAKFRYFKPCVKQYLRDHVQSRLLYVYPSEWDIAIFLPTERFQKTSKSQVYAQSKKIIGSR